MYLGWSVVVLLFSVLFLFLIVILVLNRVIVSLMNGLLLFLKLVWFVVNYFKCFLVLVNEVLL